VRLPNEETACLHAVEPLGNPWSTPIATSQGVLIRMLESPRTGIAVRDSAPRGLFPMERILAHAEGPARLPHDLFHSVRPA